MSGDPSKASIWPDADVYIAPVGTEVPTTADEFGAGWDLVGLLDGEAGFVASREEEVEDHYAWGGILVRTSRRNFKSTMAFTALEDNETTRDLLWPDSAPGTIVVPRPQRVLVAFDLSEEAEGKRKRLITAYQAEVVLNADVTEAEGDLTRYEFLVTVFPDADGVLWLDQNGLPAILETFPGEDGPLDGARDMDLMWRRRVFTHDYPIMVEGNEAEVAAEGPGTYEMCQVPHPNVTSPDHEITCDVTSVARGLGFANPAEYVIDIGGIVRYKDREGGTNYRGYAAGIGRNNVFLAPGHTWHLAIFRVDGTPTPTATLLDIAILGDTAVTLPGEFTLTADGSTISCSFTHAGSGGTMECSAVDATYADGEVAFGGSNVLEAGDTGSIKADNWAARNL